MTKHRYSMAGLVLVAFLLVGILGCSGPSVIPEMKDVIDNFTDRAKRETVLNKYGAPGVVPQELTVCDMAKPVISKTEEKEGITYYTLESRVEKCGAFAQRRSARCASSPLGGRAERSSNSSGEVPRGARWSIDVDFRARGPLRCDVLR